MIKNDEQLKIEQRQLRLVEEIVESWRQQLLPHNPKNFAIYAEGAIEQAEKLKAEIDEYLERKKGKAPETKTNGTPPTVGQQPTNVT